MRRVVELSAASILAILLLFGNAFGRPRAPDSQRKMPTSQTERQRSQKYVPGQLLVRFRPRTGEQAIQAQHSMAGAQILKGFRVVENLQLVRLAAGMSVEEAMRYYRARPDILYAEPNYTRHADQSQVTPSDPRYPEMWNLHNTGQSGGTPGADIHAPEAWGLTTDSSSVVVAVIDTGIDYNHVDLSANVWSNAGSYTLTLNGKSVTCGAGTHGFNPLTQTCDPLDDNGHGTHVAGIIGASGNNGAGVVGVNWQVQLMACKSLDMNGGGNTADAIACLEYLALMKDSGVNLVATNNSYGGSGFSQAEMDAINSLRQRGILFIASAGNNGGNADLVPQYPAGYNLPNILAVAATDSSDALAAFSNFGRHTVQLGAPGVEILSTVPESLFGDLYLSWSGTSMAAPHVTGVAALLKAQSQARDWKAIKNLILAGGDTIPAAADTIAQKRLNAYGSLACSNSVVQSRLLPMVDDVYVSPGGSLSFAMLNINCTTPNGAVEVSVDGGQETLVLSDDGVDPDQEANDGVYAAQRQWLASEIGDHTLTFPDNDVLTVHVVSSLAPYTYSTNVPFDYREIDGTVLQLRDDDSATIRPPFSVQFGGQSFPTLNVNSNGNVTFYGPFAEWENLPLPETTTPAIIAPFWDDLAPLWGTNLNVVETGSVRWDITGTAPNRELIIEWRDVSMRACFWAVQRHGAPKFQIVFFENSSDILFNYANVTITEYDPYYPYDPDDWGCAGDVNGGATATVGVQSTSSLANQFSFNTASLTNGSSILWQIGQITPAITRLSPFGALAGGPGLSLRVIGHSFLPGAAVRWNGSSRPTTFINGGELTADISAADLATADTAQITVLNPEPNGGPESASATFQVYSSYHVPTLTSITPNEIAWHPAGFVFTLTGANFVPASVARWDGTQVATTVLSETELQVTVSNDVMSIGTDQVTVFNPAPGGTSNALPVSVVNPVPVVQLLTPSLVSAGAPGFDLWVSGYNFTPTSIVRWNASDRATRFADVFHVVAQIPSSDVASVGTAQITVFNPAPSGGTSEPLTVSIGEPPAEGSGFTLASSPTSNTVPRGASATYTITVAPQAGDFIHPIALSCSVAPAGPICSVSDSIVTLGATPASATLTVDTRKVSGLEMGTDAALFFPFWIVLPAAGLVAVRRILPGAKSANPRVFLAVLLIVALTWLIACGGGAGTFPSPPPPSPQSRVFTVTVVGASGTISQQTSVSLTVTF